MLLNWFDTSKVRRFAEEFVEDLDRIKAGGLARGDKMQQIGKRMEKVLDQAQAFEHAQKLNVYQKATLLQNVRTGLSSRDWSTVDVEAIVNELLTRRLRTHSGARSHK